VLRLDESGAQVGAPEPGRKVMGRIGGGELLLIAIIALLVFGAGRLSDIGKGLGEGIKNFKKGMKDEPEPNNAKLDVKPGESNKAG
jgi:sec-independent protein translocase protein TatA